MAKSRVEPLVFPGKGEEKMWEFSRVDCVNMKEKRKGREVHDIFRRGNVDVLDVREVHLKGFCMYLKQ